jgi:isopentenyldiphosphate isomerase
LEVWLFTTKNKNQKLVFQKEEVNDAKWVTKEELLKLKDEGKFEVNAFFEEVLNS